MIIKGLTNHESHVLKTLFMKAIKKGVAEEALNECWERSGIVGRDIFEEFLVEGAVMGAICLLDEQFSI